MDFNDVLKITKSEAIKRIKDIISLFSKSAHIPITNKDLDAFDLAIKALENSRWIPVTERLPENKTKVLITNKLGEVIEILWNTWAQMEYQYEPDKYKAVAWMPLPKPYTKEETT